MIYHESLWVFTFSTVYFKDLKTNDAQSERIIKRRRNADILFFFPSLRPAINYISVSLVNHVPNLNIFFCFSFFFLLFLGTRIFAKEQHFLMSEEKNVRKSLSPSEPPIEIISSLFTLQKVLSEIRQHRMSWHIFIFLSLNSNGYEWDFFSSLFDVGITLGGNQ